MRFTIIVGSLAGLCLAVSKSKMGSQAKWARVANYKNVKGFTYKIKDE
jgi:hypothetical protein